MSSLASFQGPGDVTDATCQAVSRTRRRLPWLDEINMGANLMVSISHPAFYLLPFTPSTEAKMPLVRNREPAVVPARLVPHPPLPQLVNPKIISFFDASPSILFTATDMAGKRNLFPDVVIWDLTKDNWFLVSNNTKVNDEVVYTRVYPIATGARIQTFKNSPSSRGSLCRAQSRESQS